MTTTANIIKFTNNFHNTSVELKVKRIPRRSFTDPARWFISNGQANKAKKTLCGMTGCTCGGNIGERPGLDIVPVDGGYVFYSK